MAHDQLQHDLLAWIAAGHLPQALPVPIRPARVTRALESLLARPQPRVHWSIEAWAYSLTPTGSHELAVCTAHTVSEPVATALAVPPAPALGRAG